MLPVDERLMVAPRQLVRLTLHGPNALSGLTEFARMSVALSVVPESIVILAFPPLPMPRISVADAMTLDALLIVELMAPLPPVPPEIDVSSTVLGVSIVPVRIRPAFARR